MLAITKLGRAEGLHSRCTVKGNLTWTNAACQGDAKEKATEAQERGQGCPSHPRCSIWMMHSKSVYPTPVGST